VGVGQVVVWPRTEQITKRIRVAMHGGGGGGGSGVTKRLVPHERPAGPVASSTPRAVCIFLSLMCIAACPSIFLCITAVVIPLHSSSLS